MKRMKNALKIIAVNGVILFVLIVVLEIIFGGWFDANRLNRLNMLKDRVFMYDISDLYSDPNPVITYTRDKYGLRGNYRTIGEIDMLTVGGSTTDQRFIRDGETWQDILQQNFRQAGKKAVVANAGIDGQSTYGYIKNFRWWYPNVPGLKPKYILYYVGLNDFYAEAGWECDGLEEAKQSYNMETMIRQRSAVWHTLRTMSGAYRAMVVEKISHRSVDFSREQWTDKPLQQDYGFMKARLEAYAERLRILADKTCAMGAKPVFVSQPLRRYKMTPGSLLGHDKVNYYEGRPYNGVDFYIMLRKLDGVTKSVAAQKGALFVDMGGKTGWDDGDFYDFYHMTPKGAKKFGTLLYEELKDKIRTCRI